MSACTEETVADCLHASLLAFGDVSSETELTAGATLGGMLFLFDRAYTYFPNMILQVHLNCQTDTW